MFLYTITIKNKGLVYKCKDNQNLLVSLEKTHQADFISGCRQGGCGFCRIKILEGTYETGPMSIAHIRPEDQEQGIVLACRTYPTSDLTFEYLGFQA